MADFRLGPFSDLGGYVAKKEERRIPVKYKYVRRPNNVPESQLIKFRAFQTVKTNRKHHFCHCHPAMHESVPLVPGHLGVWRAADVTKTTVD